MRVQDLKNRAHNKKTNCYGSNWPPPSEIGFFLVFSFPWSLALLLVCLLPSTVVFFVSSFRSNSVFVDEEAEAKGDKRYQRKKGEIGRSPDLLTQQRRVEGLFQQRLLILTGCLWGRTQKGIRARRRTEVRTHRNQGGTWLWTTCLSLGYVARSSGRLRPSSFHFRLQLSEEGDGGP